MKRTPNYDAKALPQGWSANNAITTVEQVESVDQVTRFQTPFSNVKLYRMPFANVLHTVRQLQLNAPAVYAVVMTSDKVDVQSNVYVGSTGSSEERFKRHQYDPRFTSKAHSVYVLTTTSLEANKAHMCFVEGVFNRMTGDQPNVEVISQDVPAFELGAHDEHIVKVIIKDAISLFAAAGYPMNAHADLVLKNIPFLDENELSNDVEEVNASSTSIAIENVLWTFSAPAGVLGGYQMSGAYLSTGRFIVFPGSHFRISDEHKLAPNLQATRNHLKSSGYLKANKADDGRLELIFPFEFASPQQAVHAMLKSNKPVEGYWSQTPMGRSSTPSEL